MSSYLCRDTLTLLLLLIWTHVSEIKFNCWHGECLTEPLPVGSDQCTKCRKTGESIPMFRSVLRSCLIIAKRINKQIPKSTTLHLEQLRMHVDIAAVAFPFMEDTHTHTHTHTLCLFLRCELIHRCATRLGR